MTLSTTAFRPGAVVRANIVFAEGGTVKRRPAVVLTDSQYHRSRSDAIVLALSSQTSVTYHGDCDIVDWQSAGLPLPTKAKGVIQTIDRSSVDRQYGNLTEADLEKIRENVRMILCLA